MMFKTRDENPTGEKKGKKGEKEKDKKINWKPDTIEQLKIGKKGNKI